METGRKLQIASHVFPGINTVVWSQVTTLDNGGWAFTVYYSHKDKTASVLLPDEESKSSDVTGKVTGKTVARYKNIAETFLGECGCTVLLRLESGKYIFIGEQVVEFRLAPGERMMQYLSTIGPSECPYTIMYCTKNTYFLGLSTFKFHVNKPGVIFTVRDQWKTPGAKKLKIKIIHERP